MIDGTQLLATKLFIPSTGPELVSRPRLVERLNEGVHRRLSLISAPAGFGKTTLVSEWTATAGRPVVWLSLDEGDSDPARFKSMGGRFKSPVIPGERLDVHMWVDGATALFQTRAGDRVVFDAGVCSFT